MGVIFLNISESISYLKERNILVRKMINNYKVKTLEGYSIYLTENGLIKYAMSME